MMKKLYYSMFMAVISLIVFASCSSEDEAGSFEISQLVGSEWKSSYEWIDTDNLSMESGTEVLVFNSSNQAKRTTEYSGKGWDYNYNLGEEEYKSYSGTRYTFFEYTVSGNTIHLQATDDSYYTIDLVVSGNKLIDNSDDRIWDLVKAGDGVESEESSAYSWSNMSGFWMIEDPYTTYAAIIAQYESQNASSSAYLGNPEYGYFNCEGMHFNSDGQKKKVVMEMRAFENTLTLDRINASDQNVYWTNIYTSSYSGIAYTIHGNQIYYGGEPQFNILNSNMITDMNGTVYVRAQ